MHRSAFQLDSLRPKVPSYTVISERSTGNETAHDSLPGSQESPHNQTFLQRPPQDHPSVLYTAPWLPGGFKCVPWLGLCALGISILCMAVSIGVLIKSNGQPVVYWPIQPTVVLAVTSALANVALRLALAKGVPITWWDKAMQGGTIGDLHRYWSFGIP